MSRSHSVALGVSKSLVIDLPRDIKDVLVADPTIANVVVRSSRRAYIIGIKQGQTSVFIFDAQGKQIASLDLAVMRDLNGIRAALKHVLPNDDITVEGIGDAVVLSGTVASQLESQQAYDMASRLVEAVTFFGTIATGSAQRVVNALVVRGRDQVMLKVTVAEVERDVIKQLGVNLSGSLGYGTAVVNFNNTNPFSAYGQSLSGSAINGTFKSVTATLQAMEQASVIHTLAEPNLTAISGETATFMAGGEFPVLNGYSCSPVSNTPGAATTCQPAITFKKFGVGLNFTPVVLSEGRISLKVMTEVSDLSTQNSITVVEPGSTASATIPSIRTRRADTTVEIPSGGTLAMAGMIQDDTKHNINGLPGLAELPVLGPLFRSNDYLNQRTELVVLVTPYIVRAVAQKDLSKPDDGFADPSDPAQVLLGHFNRIYGVGGGGEIPIGRKVITAVTGSSSIEAGVRRRSMHTVRTMTTGRRGSAAAALRAAIVTGFGLLVCACQTDQITTAAPDVPYDYRLRHPITITEAERTLQLFIGANRGELTAEQRAELLAFAQTWKQEATGGVLIDLPTGTVNEALSGGGATRNSIDPGGDRRAAEGHDGAQLSGQCAHAGDRPHHLSENHRASRPLRHVAGRYRADLQPRLFRKPAALEFWLREPAQSRRHGRKSVRPGAAAARDAALQHAAHQGDGEISRR